MNKIKDYEEKKRILTYFCRESKGGVSKEHITRTWLGWWKEDAEAIKDAAVLEEICNTVLKLVIPTRKMGRRATLDYQKNELFKYKNKQYKILLDNAKAIGWEIQNRTLKKHPHYLGRYRIKGTDYVGSYDEIMQIIKDRRMQLKKMNEKRCISNFKVKKARILHE